MSDIFPETFKRVGWRITTASDGISSELAAQLKEGRTRVGTSAILRNLCRSSMKVDWEPLAEAVEALFSNPQNNLQQGFLETAVEALVVLSPSEQVMRIAAERLASQGTLFRYLTVKQFARTRPGVLTILVLLLAYDGIDPVNCPPQAREGSQSYSAFVNGHSYDDALLRIIADLALEFGVVGDLEKRKVKDAKLDAAIAAVVKTARQKWK